MSGFFDIISQMVCCILRIFCIEFYSNNILSVNEYPRLLYRVKARNQTYKTLIKMLYHRSYSNYVTYVTL